ncbi:UNVERIFIED_CONTAM: hypothetical protein RMT77_013459 [Armadillidium vulgare]
MMSVRPKTYHNSPNKESNYLLNNEPNTKYHTPKNESTVPKNNYGTSNGSTIPNGNASFPTSNGYGNRIGDSGVGGVFTGLTISQSVDSTREAVETKAYRTRFWILCVFSYHAFVTIFMWGSFGPIMASAEYAFGWSTGYVALLGGWGCLFSLLCMVPFNWCAQRYGLRNGMMLASTFIAVSAGIRCLSTDTTRFTYLASAGAIINGMGSCLTLSLPAMLSSTWFPMEERATATAVAAVATQLGGAGMYLSPLLVRTPDDILTKDEIANDIFILMYIHFGMAAAGFIAAFLYFPEKPSKPPSVSSSMERINYFTSIKLIMRNPQVLCVITAYVFSMSIPLTWVSIMNFSLECLGVAQTESMWIAITACLASPLFSFVVARVTDHSYGYLKVTILGLLLSSSCFYIWILLMTETVASSSYAALFVAVVFAISLQYSSVPLLIELAAELAYPCPESVIGAILTIMMDIVDTVFLLVLMVPSKCFQWVSYCLLGSSFLTIIPMMFVKEVHKRSDQDLEPITVDEERAS